MRASGLVVLVMTAGICIAGCSQEKKVEGQWIAGIESRWDGTKYISKVETKKNGPNFIITVKNEQYRATGVRPRTATWEASSPKTVTATFKEGKLVVDPFVSFTYVEKDGTLLGPQGEVYKKETPQEYTRLKQEATASYIQHYPGASLSQ